MKLPEELLQKLKKSGYTKKEINILREQKAKKFYFVEPRIENSPGNELSEGSDE